MNVQNTYRNDDAVEALRADYEKAYLKYEKLKQPSLTDVQHRLLFAQVLHQGDHFLLKSTTGGAEMAASFCTEKFALGL